MSTDTSINVPFIEMMASKICHDLISPISAVNNGVEFMEDLDSNLPDDITDLIAFSAKQASAKLQAYRLAYGAGGRDTSIKIEDAYNAIQNIIQTEKKITQHWNSDSAFFSSDQRENHPPKALPKILTAVLLMALEFLPRGGELSVEPSTPNTIIVHAKGTGALVREGFTQALKGALEMNDLEPKFMHPFMTGILARHYGYTTHVDTTQDHVQLSLSIY